MEKCLTPEEKKEKKAAIKYLREEVNYSAIKLPSI